MIFHVAGVFLGVAQDLAGRQDDGQAGIGKPAQVLADPVDFGSLAGGEASLDIGLHQQGPGLQVGFGLGQVKLTPGGGNVPGEGQQGEQGDQQIGRKELPDQALAGHDAILP